MAHVCRGWGGGLQRVGRRQAMEREPEATDGRQVAAMK